MPNPWTRAGDLQDIASYPLWVREIVAALVGAHPVPRDLEAVAAQERAA